jgi:methyl-accepting chemotaxis protein
MGGCSKLIDFSKFKRMSGGKEQNFERFSFKNLKVIFKLYSSYTLILMILLLVGGVSLYAGSQLEEATQEIYEQRLTSITEMLTLSAGFEHLNSSVSSTLLLNSDSAGPNIVSINQSIEQLKQEIQQISQNQEAYGISMDEIQTFSLIWDGYNEDLGKVLDWIKIGQKEIGSTTGIGLAIGTYNNQLVPKINGLTKILSGWVVKNDQLALASYDKAKQLQKQIEIVQIILIVMAAVVSALVGWLVARSIVVPLRMVVRAADDMAQGALNQKVELERKDELGQLALSFNQMSVNIRTLIERAKKTGEQVAVSSEQLSQSAEQTKQAINQITLTIQEVAAGTETQVQGAEESAKAMEEMSKGIQRIAEKSTVVLDASVETVKEAEQGNDSIQKAVRQMDSISHSVNHSASVIKSLGERSKEIGEIVEVITSISSQTNLLALNAAIEAARAGEHGRGFAVVADEVRKLAEQSRKSAEQITDLIQKIQEGTTQAVSAMIDGTREVETGIVTVHQTGEAFKLIVKAAQRVAEQIEEVSASSQQMSASSQQVTASVEEIITIAKESAEGTQNIATASEEQLASVEEISGSADALNKMAQELKEVIGKFKL